MKHLATTDPEIASLIDQEFHRQNVVIPLIASENYTSLACMEAVGSVLTNKYAEGYPGRRYYGGCEFHDEIERIAIARAKNLFGAEHANVQPHAGATANQAVYMAAINHGDTILAMRLDHGGHLTHGAKVNFSGKSYNVIAYGVHAETELIDYDEVERLAIEHKPKLIVAGASAYARIIDFARFAEIAKKVEAKLFVDMAHIAGLVAVGLHPSPVPHADFVSTTTHKTLRGPRGGLILCKEKYAKAIDSAVFPGLQGGPLMHAVGGKAVCLKEAATDNFKKYQGAVIKNAKVLATELAAYGFRLVSGGTDNHLVLVDLRNKNISGQDAEQVLEAVGLVANKNKIPFDPAPAQVTSGLRLGTPAATTRGMGEGQMLQIADWIVRAIENPKGEANLAMIKAEVLACARQFPVYAELGADL